MKQREISQRERTKGLPMYIHTRAVAPIRKLKIVHRHVCLLSQRAVIDGS